MFWWYIKQMGKDCHFLDLTIFRYANFPFCKYGVMKQVWYWQKVISAMIS